MSINYFDEIFFSNYIKDEDEVLDVCHKHVVTILDTIILWIFFWAILPTFFFYNNSFWLRDIIPFIYYEAYLFIVYLVLIYKIFDWYNDVWIISNKWIIDLDRNFMNNKIVYIDYNDVKWIELHQETMLDWMLGKWEIRIHAMWGGAFILEDAKSPWDVVKYIQWILEDSEKAKKDKDKTLNEKLLSTLKWVIKEHLDKNWFDGDLENLDDENNTEEMKALNKVLNKKWTVDLRI